MLSWKPVGSIGPKPRSLHGGVVVGDSMYIFGGYDGCSRVNDLHRFDLETRVWTHVTPLTGQAPSPRDRFSMMAYGNQIFVFGGFDGTNRVNDLWRFDIARTCWMQVDQGSIVVTPRHSHSGVAWEGSLFVMFGFDGNYRQDLHEFSRGKWSFVSAKGQVPKARYRSSAVTYGDRMFVFGGHDGTRHLEDLHSFDFSSQSWTLVQTTKPPTISISRDSHTAVVHRDSMLVFGGSSGCARSDLLEFKFLSRDWVELQPHSDQSAPRFCHVSVVYKDCLLLHAGYDGEKRLGDFVSYSILDNALIEVPMSTLVEDLTDVLGRESFADVAFVLEDESRVLAHRVILARCEFFRAMFHSGMRERDQQEIAIPNISSGVFKTLLKYLYTDEVAELTLDEAAAVFEAADRFGIDRLKRICEQRILAAISIDNACGILLTADRHSASSLRKRALDFVLRHYDAVVQTQAFEALARTNVELVLELVRVGVANDGCRGSGQR